MIYSTKHFGYFYEICFISFKSQSPQRFKHIIWVQGINQPDGTVYNMVFPIDRKIPN